MIRSIWYVSRSTLVMPAEESRVQDIVDWSRGWNAEVGITGALMFTEKHFAQVIEGPLAPIAELMGKIRVDPRHTGIDVILDRLIPARQFAGWTMAYSGPEDFVEAQLAPLAAGRPPEGRIPAAHALIAVMQGLSRLGAA